MKPISCVALVTGGSRGIGRAITETLLKDGHRVAICARSQSEIDTAATALQAQFSPDFCRAYQADITRAAEIERLVGAIAQDWSDIDILVNNAAIPGPFGPLESHSREDWAKAIDVNLLGTVNCIRAVLPAMKRRGAGVIINLCGAGVGWRNTAPNQTAYTTSKYAVYGLTESLASEVAAYGIRVNAVSPGPVDTPLRKGLLPTEAADIPHAGLTPQAAAELVSFLASARSGGLTGKLISAQWDNRDSIAGNWKALNESCAMTVRKIDGRNYFSS